jgi:hypothetical protein
VRIRMEWQFPLTTEIVFFFEELIDLFIIFDSGKKIKSYKIIEKSLDHLATNTSTRMALPSLLPHCNQTKLVVVVFLVVDRRKVAC